MNNDLHTERVTISATFLNPHAKMDPRLRLACLGGIEARVASCFVLTFVAGILACPACAPLRADDASNIAPFVGEATIVVTKIDFDRIGLPNIAESLKVQTPEFRKAYENWSMQTMSAIEALRAATAGQSLYGIAAMPHSQKSWPVFLVLKSEGGAKPDALAGLLPGAQASQATSRDGWSVLAPLPGADVARLLELSPPAPRPEIASALEAVKGYPIQLALVPPAVLRDSVRDLLPNLPPQLGGGPSVYFTEGVKWAALGADPADPRLELVVQSSSPRAAGELAAHLPLLLKSLGQAALLEAKQAPAEAVALLLTLVEPKVEGDRVVVRIDGKERIGVAVNAWASIAGAVSEEWRERTDSDRMRQILIAMHNYHDAHGSFPPEQKHRDEKGASKLSWRVHLLPYLEQVPLYNQFHLDEAWDSPHNKPLVEKMPDIFKSGAEGVAPGRTTFLAPLGDGTVFGGAKSAKFQDVRDGTSMTVVLVDVKPELAAPWTAPDDYAFEPQDPGKGLRVGADGRFLAGFADGSVTALRGDLTVDRFLAIFGMNDGEAVDWDAIR